MLSVVSKMKQKKPFSCPFDQKLINTIQKNVQSFLSGLLFMTHVLHTLYYSCII